MSRYFLRTLILFVIPTFLLFNAVSAQPEGMLQLLDFSNPVSENCPRPEPTGVTYFGGTVWDAADGRWEAIPGSVWTFESGVGSAFTPVPDVNPYKAPGLHTLMEGWIGLDRTYHPLPYFRRLSTANFPGIPCVGSPAGLSGSWSFWAGVLPAEADYLHYLQGQGYGNHWKTQIIRPYNYTGGDVTLQFDYVNDTEPGKDFTRVILDPGTLTYCDDPNPNAFLSYTGSLSGHESVVLHQGVELPASPGTVYLIFQVESDGSGSHEDCGYGGSCGAFAVDNIQLSGGITQALEGFETGNGGWGLADCPGPGGDWSDILALSDLPPSLDPCQDCAIQDSVLAFIDLNLNGHGEFQDNLAMSPWVDLQAAGLADRPGKFVEFDLYAELPIRNYVCVEVAAEYSPSINLITGNPAQPQTVLDLPRIYTMGSTCSRPGSPVRVDLSHLIDETAQSFRVGVGVVNLCRFYPDCAGSSSPTPYFDNIRVGVYGDPQLPALATHPVDLPQDSFPKDGTFLWSSPGRADCGLVLSDAEPRAQPQTSTGDTMVVRGGIHDAEVRVVFAVRPGPYIAAGGPNNAAFTSWLTSHPYEGHFHGLDWYSARMDTAEIGGCTVPGVWMTAYHELDPHFTGSDTEPDLTDLDPFGHSSRLKNDIFPDNMFTPGTRLMLFYKARHTGSGVWTVEPDTTGGCVYEMEVLPSSMTATGSYNRVLYVDHADGYGAQPLIETGLAAIMPGSSANFESTAWDRWDARAPSSGNVSLGRPSLSEYGVAAGQIDAFHTVIYNTGSLSGFNLVNVDRDLFDLYLTTLGGSLFASGDNLASWLNHPDGITFLNDRFGATVQIHDYRYLGSPLDLTDCVELQALGLGGGAHFDGNDGTAAASGNGCPESRSFDVLGLTQDPDAAGNENFATTARGVTSYESVSHDVYLPNSYRAVLDGVSLHQRRDDTACLSTTPIEDRLCHVLGWFWGTGSMCAMDTTATLAGTKFDDQNANGVRDPGEPGLPGWTITLLQEPAHTPIASTVTDANGDYAFSGLPPNSTYGVRETQQNGWIQTAPGSVWYQEPVGTGQTLSGLDFGNADSCGVLSTITLTAGVADDFDTTGTEPFFPDSTLRAQCYSSNVITSADSCADAHCVQHTFTFPVPPGCKVVSGVLTAHLKACGGGPDTDTFTLREGPVSAWGVLMNTLYGSTWTPGATMLVVLDLANLPASPWGVTDALACLQDGNLGITIQDDTMVDYMTLQVGLCCESDTTATLAGMKFHDLNGNGVRDIGEPGLAGVQISVRTGTGTLVGSATTGADGSYQIAGVAPGPDFWVSEAVPAGMVQTAPSTVVYRFPLAAGDVIPGLDFGNRDTCEAIGFDTFTAGVDDNFDLGNGDEYLFPGPDALRSFCVQADTILADQCTLNLCRAHTFADMVPAGCRIESAVLTIRLKACGPGSDNDSFSFNEAGGSVAWGMPITDLRQALNGEPHSWNQGETTLLVMDLADLPASAWGVTNALGCLQDGSLNVFVQDDTGVDFMRLDISYCCDPGVYVCAAPPKGMCAWWPGDAVIGNAVDLIQPPRGGSLNGDADYGPGVVGTGFVFDGSFGDHVFIPNAPKLSPPNELTIDGWFITTDTRANGPKTVVRKLGSGGPFGKGFWVFIDQGYLMLQYGDGVTGDGFSSISMVADGKAHHFALTMSHSRVDLYLDGVPIYGHLFVPPMGVFTTSAPLYVGGGLGYDLAATIDEVEFFDRKLRQDEIQDIVDAYVEGKCREFCYVPEEAQCQIGPWAFISPSICNDTAVSQTYVWSVVALPPGAGCTVSGPTQILPASGTITVPPGGCAGVGTVRIACPAGMAASDRACYEFRAYHQGDPNQTPVVRCQGKICPRQPGWRVIAEHETTGNFLAARFDSPDSALWDTLQVRFAIENESDPGGAFDYLIEAVTADGDTTADPVTFLGEAPGQPILGTETLAVGETGHVVATLLYPACEPFRPRRIRLRRYPPDPVACDPSAEVGVRPATSYQITGVSQGPDPIAPRRLTLAVHPNPFASSTSIEFTLPRRESAQLRVYDVTGRLVRTLWSGSIEPGLKRFVWDGVNDAGSRIGSGIYFIHLSAGDDRVTRKVVLVQ